MESGTGEVSSTGKRPSMERARMEMDRLENNTNLTFSANCVYQGPEVHMVHVIQCLPTKHRAQVQTPVPHKKLYVLNIFTRHYVCVPLSNWQVRWKIFIETLVIVTLILRIGWPLHTMYTRVEELLELGGSLLF
jgi:hypothetical protein